MQESSNVRIWLAGKDGAKHTKKSERAGNAPASLILDLHKAVQFAHT